MILRANAYSDRNKSAAISILLDSSVANCQMRLWYLTSLAIGPNQTYSSLIVKWRQFNRQNYTILKNTFERKSVDRWTRVDVDVPVESRTLEVSIALI